jgi:hypothetical protein
VPIVLKSGSLILLEPSRPVQGLLYRFAVCEEQPIRQMDISAILVQKRQISGVGRRPSSTVVITAQAFWIF